MEDSRIIELFFERSEAAITELSKKYGAVCKRVADNILNSKQDSEECLNDAFFGVWNSIPPNNPEKLSSYVCKIVRNTAIKRFHQNTALKRNSAYDVALDELENCFPSSDFADAEYDARETAKAINRFLEALDRKSRVMFVRRYFHGDSIEDIAKLFGTSSHNVSVRLSRIRKKLMYYLKEEGISL